MGFFNFIKHIFKKNIRSFRWDSSIGNIKSYEDAAKFKSNIDNFLSYYDFGQAYVFIALVFFILGKHSASSLVLAARENFSAYVLFELLLFVFILFCFLTFFGLMKKFQYDFNARPVISKIYVSNVISLFVAYAFFLFLNFLGYTWPKNFYILFRSFWTANINLHSHEYILLLAKLFYLFLACTTLFSLSNYLINKKITFQYYNLVVLMIWAGLIVMSLLNIFYIILIFDSISLMVVAVVGLSSFPKFEIYLTYALHYFTLSAVTSLFAYAGCLLLHGVFNSFNINAIVFILREGGMPYLAEQNAFILGCAFIFIKIFFLLGLFPFYQYVLEVSSAVNYGFLFYFLIVSKLPVIIFLLYFIKIVWLNFLVFKKLILLISVSSIVFSTLFIATTLKIKQFFALSSINQIGFVVSLFAFNDVLGASVGVLYFVTYCVSVAPLLIFLTYVINLGYKENTDGDLDTWPDLSRCVHDTYLTIKNRRDSNIFTNNPISNFENQNLFVMLGLVASSLGLITLAGFPPAAGFFLKMSFVEVFIAHHYYITAIFVVFSSLVTAYAYTNVLILFQPEFRWFDANNNLYRLKIFVVNKNGGFLFFIFSILMFIVLLFSANSFFFEIFVIFINLFFYDNNYHFALSEYLYFFNSNFSDQKIAFFLLTFKNISWKRFNYLLKWRYYLTNFVGKSYSNELLILVATLGFFWWFFAFFYYQTNLFDWTEWPEPVFYVFYAFQRLILFHFFLYLMCLSALEAWIPFRVFFIFYLLLELFSYVFFKFNFIITTVYYYYMRDIFFNCDWVFEKRMVAVNHYLDLYYTAFSLPIVFFITMLAWGFFNNLKNKMPFIENSQNFVDFFKTSSNYYAYSAKNSILDGFNFFVVKHPSFFAFFSIFYVWLLTFGGFFSANACVFHGPYFILKVSEFVIKIITINWILPAFVVWAILFHSIYFWFKDIKSIKESRAFLNYILEYYIDENTKIADFATRLKNFLYLFLVFVMPFFMIFDISIISLFIQTYLFFIDELHFWSVFFILVGFLYVVVLLILPNNDPQHPQGNVRLFCLWIFNLSLLINLFFLNSTVLYAFGKNAGFYDRRSFSEGPIFTKLSDVIDSVSIGTVGESFSKFLPMPNIGIFSFGYDYFAILLCFATSLIFSLIFLTSLFSAALSRKRYYFFNLFVIEICVLFSFLNLNLLGFFIFFESSLVPMFIIVGLWGSSDRRWLAAKQMLFYSLTASTPMIVCMVHLYSNYGSLDYTFLYNNMNYFSYNEKLFFWFSLFLMFATKVPMFPFHSWLLNAHVEAPTGGSIILAAILLKLGIFGIVRYLLQFLGEVSVQMAPIVIVLALIGVFYSSVCAITELDCKRLIAHTSIAHMNLSVIGLFIFDERGFVGAIYLSIGHVVTSAALFFLIGTLYDRFHTRNLLVFGGLVQLMPVFSSFLFFFVMANSGFPWTLSFIGEFLLLSGAARTLSLLVYLILIVASVCLLYANLRLFVFICFGTINKNLIHNSVSDLTFLEFYCITLLTFNGFILMWNSDLFFSTLAVDNLVRIIF